MSATPKQPFRSRAMCACVHSAAIVLFPDNFTKLIEIIACISDSLALFQPMSIFYRSFQQPAIGDFESGEENGIERMPSNDYF